MIKCCCYWRIDWRSLRHNLENGQDFARNSLKVSSLAESCLVTNIFDVIWTKLPRKQYFLLTVAAFVYVCVLYLLNKRENDSENLFNGKKWSNQAITFGCRVSWCITKSWKLTVQQKIRLKLDDKVDTIPILHAIHCQLSLCKVIDLSSAHWYSVHTAHIPEICLLYFRRLSWCTMHNVCYRVNWPAISSD